MTKHSILTLQSVNETNWREVCAVKVKRDQKSFVAEPSYYLALCSYSSWHPLAIVVNEKVIGFLMWAQDEDDSFWFGGLTIDKKEQCKGYGRIAIQKAMRMLSEFQAAKEFALSYEPTNVRAKHLYSSIGFGETGEFAGDEVVARLRSGI